MAKAIKQAKKLLKVEAETFEETATGFVATYATETVAREVAMRLLRGSLLDSGEFDAVVDGNTIKVWFEEQ